VEIRQLEMLLAVVEKRGYVRAGEFLHIAHSAIHRQIRILEGEIREPLLVRAGRSVRLTAVGELLVDAARRLRAEVQKIESQIADLRQVQTGVFWLGTSTTTLVLFLSPVLARFRREFPGVEVQLLTGTADQVIQEMASGHLDLAIVNEPPDGIPKEKHLEYRRLYEEEIVFATSRWHSLARRRSVRLEEIAKLPLAMFTSTSRIRCLIDSVFQRHALRPRVAMELETEEAVAKVIEDNMAAGFVTKRRAEREHLPHARIAGERLLLHIAIVTAVGYVPRKAGEFIRICEAQTATARGRARPA